MANSSKLHGAYDLLAIIALTALLIISIVFIPSDIPRIIIGLPFLVFFPGYTLVAALFPRKQSLAAIERVALSLVLSLAVVPLIGLLLNYLWEISLYPILISVASFLVAMCALAYLRRYRLLAEERFEPHMSLSMSQWSGQSGLDRALVAVLAIAIVGAVATAIHVGMRPESGDKFTEFYLLGSEGTLQYYPQDIVLGTSADVIVGVVNHEGKNVTYQVRITVDGADLETKGGISLHGGETWEETAILMPTMAGDNQEVEFLLYRDGESQPYQELHLWIDVVDSAP